MATGDIAYSDEAHQQTSDSVHGDRMGRQRFEDEAMKLRFTRFVLNSASALEQRYVTSGDISKVCCLNLGSSE